MKKVFAFILALCLSVCFIGCTEQEPKTVDPQISQMKAICELAVMECYYHNVAKFFDEAEHWYEKDKKFWVEYSGVVKLGVDASQISISAEGTNVTVTIPEATVLDCIVDSESLTPESYIVDKSSADIKAEDEIAAIALAQDALWETALQDRIMLSSAQQRTQLLLEEYIMNVGAATGVEYTITWVFLDPVSSPLQGTPTTDATTPENNVA